MDLLHQPLYAVHLLVNALNQDPSRPLIQLQGGPMMSVGDVRDATSQYAQALQSLGMSKGAKVGLLSANRPEVLFVSNAVQVLAAIYVPMHPLAGLDDQLHVIKDAGVDILIFDAERFAERAAAIHAAEPSIELFAFGSSELGENLCTLANNFTPQKLIAPVVDENEILRLGYSGGTTGTPKALASVQRTGVNTVQMMLTDWEWPAKPNFLSCTPLSHAGAAMFLPILLKGGTMLVLPSFEPLAVMQAIQDYGINNMLLVPTMIYALLDHPRFDEFDLSSLETVFYGASAMSPARLKEAIERIGPVFMQFYGQAEAPMAICTLRKHEHDINNPQRLASCGRPSPWLMLELMDANDEPVADGEPGEICLRGPLLMNGYRNLPELTNETLRNQWLHTGDVAIRDADGFLRIVDRTKDMIVTGGFNVYPREVEDIISQHESVAQVAVIGVPHEKWGEAVTALVVLRSAPEQDAQQLIEELTTSVAQQKGSFQAPKTIHFIDSIPQTPVGKPDKKQLRARYAQ